MDRLLGIRTTNKALEQTVDWMSKVYAPKPNHASLSMKLKTWWVDAWRRAKTMRLEKFFFQDTLSYRVDTVHCYFSDTHKWEICEPVTCWFSTIGDAIKVVSRTNHRKYLTIITNTRTGKQLVLNKDKSFEDHDYTEGILRQAS